MTTQHSPIAPPVIPEPEASHAPLQRKPWSLTDRGPRKIDGLLTIPDRLTAWADWFDLSPPPLRYSRERPKIPDNLLLNDALLDWMIASGGSLDWFVYGDARSMAIAQRRQEIRLTKFEALMTNFDETEQRPFLEAMRANQEDDVSLDVALERWKAGVQAHRSESAI